MTSIVEPTNPKFFPYLKPQYRLEKHARETLQAIMDTLIPPCDPERFFKEEGGALGYSLDSPGLAAFLARKASDLDTVSFFEKLVQERVPDPAVREIEQLLNILSSRPGSLLLTGYFRPFTALTEEERTKVLRDWAGSPLLVKRKAFQALKTATLLSFFSVLDDQNCNANWEVLRYKPEAEGIALPSDAFEFKVLDHASFPEELECDVVVVGSGAGGGVMAGELAKAGHKVVVLEKGAYVSEKMMTLNEPISSRNMFENGGVCETVDSGIKVLAGSVLGGGTTINWSSSFRPPQHVLDEWSQELGLEAFSTPEFQESVEAVCTRLGVHDDETAHARYNEIFVQGSEALGYHHGVIPRNAVGAHSCGFCGFGCRGGHKNGTMRTFLRDAVDSGNCQIVANCYADRVIHENGEAKGVEVTLETGKKAFIKSRVTVVSCGTLHSPALLLRSKIPNKNIGRNLRLHPVAPLIGIMPEAVRPNAGTAMSWYSDQVANLDQKHYGAKLETPSLHPALYASALPWTSPFFSKKLCLGFDHHTCGIVLCRDRDSKGRVEIDAKGNPVLYYSLEAFEKNTMIQGLEVLTKLLVASGAKEVITCNDRFPTLKPTSTDPEAPEVKEFLQALHRQGIQSQRGALFSAHQMGTCKMGKSAATSVIQGTGESWEVKNLFVADASTFPTASGVNPMVTAESISHYIAQRIKDRLKA